MRYKVYLQYSLQPYVTWLTNTPWQTFHNHEEPARIFNKPVTGLDKLPQTINIYETNRLFNYDIIMSFVQKYKHDITTQLNTNTCMEYHVGCFKKNKDNVI